MPSKRQRAPSAQQRLVKSANSLRSEDFFASYLPADDLQTLSREFESESSSLSILLEGARDLGQSGAEHLEMCLQLIESTSGEDYRNSEIKWSRSKKRKEMLLPDMRYVILLVGSIHSSNEEAKPTLAGFVSFMITYEDGQEVIYCYEIHLAEAWQGRASARN